MPGTLIKRFDLPNGHWLELVLRADGAFQFHERSFPAGSQDGVPTLLYGSAAYISAETAEAAAREKFKL